MKRSRLYIVVGFMLILTAFPLGGRAFTAPGADSYGDTERHADSNRLPFSSIGPRQAAGSERSGTMSGGGEQRGHQTAAPTSSG